MVLFVISNDTRSLTSMILAAHYIGSGKDVVLCVEQLNSENCVIANETVIYFSINFIVFLKNINSTVNTDGNQRLQSCSRIHHRFGGTA